MNRTTIRQGVQRFALYGALIGLGALGSNIYNHTAVLPQIESAAAAVPKLAHDAQVAHCNQKADKKVAVQAIASAQSDSVPIPSANALDPCSPKQSAQGYGGKH